MREGESERKAEDLTVQSDNSRSLPREVWSSHFLSIHTFNPAANWSVLHQFIILINYSVLVLLSPSIHRSPLLSSAILCRCRRDISKSLTDNRVYASLASKTSASAPTGYCCANLPQYLESVMIRLGFDMIALRVRPSERIRAELPCVAESCRPTKPLLPWARSLTHLRTPFYLCHYT